MAVAAPMVAIGRLSRLLLLLLTLLVCTVRGKSTYFRVAPRTVQLGDNETTALIKTCYGVYGCFAITQQWVSLSRPVSVLPQTPKTINVKFCLYTPENPTDCQRLYDHDVLSLYSSSFMTGRPVKFLAHGYLDSGEKRWIKSMVSELLASEKQNVFVVDWVGGSGPPYTQAVANIRLVGAVLGHFIRLLKKLFGTPPEQVHVIGHSLGAHLAGYAGEFLRKRQLQLGRITGLDPAEPHFENTARVVRLDPTDALLVDVIHSDSGPLFSGGLGLLQPIGHMDFYPNGGKKQPGCGTSVFDAIKKEEGSLIYGQHYRVVLYLSDIPAALRHGGDMGNFKVRFNSNDSNLTEWHSLSESDLFFEPGQAYTYISPVMFAGAPSSVDLEWSYSSSMLNPLTWRLLSSPMIHVNRLVATVMETRDRYVFCGEDLALRSGRPSRLRHNPRCRQQQQPAGSGSLFAVLANINLVGDVGDSVTEFVDSDQSVIPTRRRGRRRGRRQRRRQKRRHHRRRRRRGHSRRPSTSETDARRRRGSKLVSEVRRRESRVADTNRRRRPQTEESRHQREGALVADAKHHSSGWRFTSRRDM